MTERKIDIEESLVQDDAENQQICHQKSLVSTMASSLDSVPGSMLSRE